MSSEITPDEDLSDTDALRPILWQLYVEAAILWYLGPRAQRILEHR